MRITKETKGKRFKVFTHFLVLLGLLIITVLQIAYSIQVSADGEKVSESEDYFSELKNKNRELSDEYAQLNSLTEISQKTESLGFVKAQNILYLQEEKEIALSTNSQR